MVHALGPVFKIERFQYRAKTVMMMRAASYKYECRTYIVFKDDFRESHVLDHNVVMLILVAGGLHLFLEPF